MDRYHFIGIGGSGMSGLARVLLAGGAAVSGSDLKPSPTLESLAAAGARIHIGHAAEHLGDPTHVVYTTACREDNPEWAEARRRGLPCLSRAELLGRMMDARRGIAVAGTHGKTTTTGMVASIFLQAGWDPAVLVGGDLPFLDGNAHPGRGRHCIAEACEAFGSFHHLHPSVSIITNVEADHLDWYGSEAAVFEAFRHFVGQTLSGGRVIACHDDPGALAVTAGAPGLLTYGLDGGDLRGVELDQDETGGAFTVVHGGETLGRLRVGVPGRHNVLNALAAVAAARVEGVPMEAISAGLAAFHGAGRRFERLGERDGVLVIDDYAHHPTELRATLAAARSLGRPLTAVFQPHLYSRTQLLLDDFSRAFTDADRVVITEIYGAREDPIPGVSGLGLAEAIRRQTPGKPVEFVPALHDVPDRLVATLHEGEALLTLGAGDIRIVAERYLAGAGRREDQGA